MCEIEPVKRLIADSCIALNAEDFNSFLSLCGSEFEYQLVVYSPEIRKEMIWMSYDRRGIETLFKEVPTHLHVPMGTLFRHVSVYSVEGLEDSSCLEARSSVLIIHTDLDGVSKLFAAGQYFDTVDVKLGKPLLSRRTMRLETRDIGSGSPIPL